MRKPGRVSAGLAVLVTSVGFVLTLSLAPATAAVSPILECVFHDTGTGQYNSLWGYNNTGSSVSYAIPSKNSFSPNPKDRGQPETFSAGMHHNLFVVTWNGSGNLKWTVNGTAATATSGSTACSSNPVPTLPGTGSWTTMLPFVLLAAGILGLGAAARKLEDPFARLEPGRADAPA